MRRISKLAFAAPALLMLSGCALTPGQDRPPVQVWPDMKNQEKYLPQSENPFFADRRADRHPVPGTVARGQVDLDNAFLTGVEGDLYLGKNPLPLDEATLGVGQTRFNTYCSPCHDRTGSGRGIVPIRTPGWLPSNLHDPRILQMVDGELFNVITYGRRSMPGYRHQVTAQDRWAIVAYVRAMQRTRTATIQDVPPEMQSELR